MNIMNFKRSAHTSAVNNEIKGNICSNVASVQIFDKKISIIAKDAIVYYVWWGNIYTGRSRSTSHLHTYNVNPQMHSSKMWFYIHHYHLIFSSVLQPSS